MYIKTKTKPPLLSSCYSSLWPFSPLRYMYVVCTGIEAFLLCHPSFFTRCLTRSVHSALPCRAARTAADGEAEPGVFPSSPSPMSPTAPSSSYAAAAPEAHAAAAPPPAVSAAALAPFQSTSDSYHSQSQHHSHAVSAASSSIPSSSPPLRSRHGFSRPLAPLQVGSWVLMSCCIIIYYSLCIPFVPAGHHAEFYSFVFIYIAIFVPGFVAYIASVTASLHRSQLHASRSPPHWPQRTLSLRSLLAAGKCARWLVC